MKKCREVINKGLCKADCCGIVMDDNDELMEVGSDGHCIHLDKQSLKCNIYDSRPSLCREYGQREDLQCPYIDLKGKIRTPAKIRRTQRMINHQVDDTMRSLDKRFGVDKNG